MSRWKRFFSSKKGEYAVVLLFFLLVAIIFTWPLILHIHDGLLGDNGIFKPTGELGGNGDALHNAWVFTWDARTFFTHPTQLFQANIIYPTRDVLAYSEHLFTLGLLAAPIYFTTRNPILAFNFLLFFAFVFSAFGCYLLVKELTGSRWGGLAAGIFFSFCPFRMARTDHLWLLFSPFLPFMLLYLYRYLGDGGKKSLVLFGILFLFQSLASWHYLLFCALAAGLLLIWTAVFSRKRQEWLRLAGVVMVMLIAIVAMLPLVLPYLRVHDRLPGFERELSDVRTYSAKAGDYLSVLPQSVIYGSAPSPFREIEAFRGAALYPGLVIVVLALAGLFIRRRKDDDAPVFEKTSFRKGALFFLILTAAGVILSFGPEIGGVSNPFYRIPYSLGILKFSRTPMRFYVLTALGLAGLAGYGTAKIAIRVTQWRKSWRAGRLAAVALVLLLLVEIATFNLTVYPVPVWGEVPEVYSWLSGQGDVRVIELPASSLGPGGHIYGGWGLGFLPEYPVDYTIRDGLSMYLSTYHWKKIVNGRSSYFPFFYKRIYTEMQAFPSERSMDLLKGLDIDFVIWHWDWVDEGMRPEYEERLAQTPGLALERDFGNEVVYRVEPGGLASVEDLEVSALSPGAVPAGEGFNLGLIALNTGGGPLVMAVEDPQPFRLRFTDPSGSAVLEEKGEYRSLFFLEPGEETSLPLSVKEVPPEGEYRVELSLEGGVLPDRVFAMDIVVTDPGELIGTGVLSGAVAFKDVNSSMDISMHDGLYPMVLEVRNNGDTFWRSSWSKKQGGEPYPYGLVSLGVGWSQGNQWVWEKQAIVLPCDLSPGQSVEVPVLVRPPKEPGVYSLFVGLRDSDVGWFGGVLILEVVVE